MCLEEQSINCIAVLMYRKYKNQFRPGEEISEWLRRTCGNRTGGKSRIIARGYGFSAGRAWASGEQKGRETKVVGYAALTAACRPTQCMT